MKKIDYRISSSFLYSIFIIKKARNRNKYITVIIPLGNISTRMYTVLGTILAVYIGVLKKKQKGEF